jgi:hypothetical protein
VQQLLTEGAAPESTLLGGIDQAGDVGGVDGDTSEVGARFHQWAAAVRGLVAREWRFESRSWGPSYLISDADVGYGRLKFINASCRS